MKYSLLSLLCFFILLPLAYTQNATPSLEDLDEDAKQELLDQGAWLITKTSANLEDISKTFNLLIQQNLTPLALDRNIVGELFLISQLSPPAEKAYQWQLGVYQSEKEMMTAMEENSKEKWVPTAMDVQDDAAFVLYIKTDDLISAARLIKVASVEELNKSLKIYYDLGYLPGTITTFKDSVWLLFIKTIGMDNIKNYEVLVRYAKKDELPTILISELKDQKTNLIDIAYTENDNVIFLFKKKLK